MPKISVILPCYNVEKYLARSINSVLTQTYANFELLVIIDGSPDNSLKIAESFKSSKINIFEKENGGLSDARNYGLERASGKYVYFMDSDDWIEPNLLEDNILIIEQANLDFIIFGYRQDDEDSQGNLIDSKDMLPHLVNLSKGDKNLNLDLHHLGLMGYAWNKIYRRKFLIENNLRFEKGVSLVEDILFNSQVYNLSETIRFNNKAYYHYINRPVITLMKMFYPNSFELKKRKIEVLKILFNHWNISNNDELVSSTLVQSIRYCIHNLFSYRNQLSFYEKAQYVKKMYECGLTKEFIKFYVPKSSKDKIYKFFIKNRMVLLTCLVARVIK